MRPTITTVDFDVGDAIIFYGSKHAHGVLPVTKGIRYSAVFFLSTKTKLLEDDLEDLDLEEYDEDDLEENDNDKDSSDEEE